MLPSPQMSVRRKTTGIIKLNDGIQNKIDVLKHGSLIHKQK